MTRQYYKFSIISGYTAEGLYKSVCPDGHWKDASAMKRARAAGIVGEVTLAHHVYDMSGKGRSSCTKRVLADS